MTKVPEYVYVVTVDVEWPVSVIVDYGDSQTAEQVEREVARRRESANVYHDGQVHVWRARLAEVREVDLMPSTLVRASLRERES